MPAEAGSCPLRLALPRESANTIVLRPGVRDRPRKPSYETWLPASRACVATGTGGWRSTLRHGDPIGWIVKDPSRTTRQVRRRGRDIGARTGSSSPRSVGESHARSPGWVSSSPVRLNDMQTEVPLAGGSVNRVVRVGNTVRRSTGTWTPAVHALLAHLRARGVAKVPHVLGLDDQDREILTFIEGRTGERPWPPALLTEDGLRSYVTLLRDYHRAVSTFVPPPGAVWRVGNHDPVVGEIIRHGDYGPWNTIWRGEEIVGIIDWDFAQPGEAILDVGQAALFGVPLQGPEGVKLAGFRADPNLRKRLQVVCAAYGDFTPPEVLDAVLAVLDLEIHRTTSLGARGLQPWSRFLAAGRALEFRTYRTWLLSNRRTLL